MSSLLTSVSEPSASLKIFAQRLRNASAVLITDFMTNYRMSVISLGIYSVYKYHQLKRKSAKNITDRVRPDLYNARSMKSHHDTRKRQ